MPFSMRKLFIAILIVAACAPTTSESPAGGGTATSVPIPFDWPFRGRDPIGSGRGGVVVSVDSRATRIGLDVLEDGGNAVDAAVAVGFALAVVYPMAGNIGGGGFMVIRKADGEVATLDFREVAPLAATPDRFLDMNGEPTQDSRVGRLSAAVPGTVAGLFEAHSVYGSKAWEELVEPAVDLAENGFTVSEVFHKALAEKALTLNRFEATARTFYRGGRPPRIGSNFEQPILAQTLRMIAEDGRNAFYRGRIADNIVREMHRGNGLMTYEDLSRYTTVWRDPIIFEYRGRTIISMGPPSSGGITIAEILNTLEGFNMRRLGYLTPESIHLFVEAARRAFADRNYYLGDPDFVDMPIERLTSDTHAADLRQSISRSRASSSELFNRVTVITEGSNTTHVSVVDSEGTAVALSYTINSSFGSGVVVDGGGFFLNNEMDDFTVLAGYANQFGLVQSENNLVGPGRRPLSSMSPTIVVDSAGQLLAVLGSPGGPKIITAVAQVIMNVIDYGMDARIATDAPRVHHQLLPDKIQFETKGIDGRTVGDLARMGHEIDPNAGYFGNIQLILRGPDGMYYGAADPRREGGRALGY